MPLSIYPRENELVKVKDVYQNTSVTYVGAVIRKVKSGEIVLRFGREVETSAEKDSFVRYTTRLVWEIRRQPQQEQVELRFEAKE